MGVAAAWRSRGIRITVACEDSLRRPEDAKKLLKKGKVFVRGVGLSVSCVRGCLLPPTRPKKGEGHCGMGGFKSSGRCGTSNWVTKDGAIQQLKDN